MKYSIAAGLIVGIALLGGTLYLVLHPSVHPSLASVSTSEAPWPAESTHLRDRLAALALPALPEEGTALHIHEHLDIYVHGRKVDVPADIGVHETAPRFISPLHTHDTTGIIHVESPTVEDFTLGQFFDIWGVRLTSACVGGYCADDANALAVYVNDAPYTGDPRALTLAPHAEIVIVYGTRSEAPKDIPDSYAFPEGY